MDIIIHDLKKEEFEQLFPGVEKDTYVIYEKESIRSCIGCFGCWIKTPGKCVIKDEYNSIGELLAGAEKVTIISRCYYGGYSPFIKTIWDRSISFLLPFFRTRRDETHHKPRYENTFPIFVYFYGEHISEEEKRVARRLVEANCANFYMSHHEVFFSESIEQLPREIK